MSKKLSEEFLEEYNFNNKSGKMSTEKYVKNKYPKDYEYIINFSITNSLDLTFKQKAYHAVNKILTTPLCNNPTCNIEVKFINTKIGYRDFCSNSCVSKTPEIIKKREQTNMKRYGVKYASMLDDYRELYRNIYLNKTEIEINNIQSKRTETNMKRFGTDNVNKNSEILNKRVKTFKNNIRNYRFNYKRTCIDKYGVDHPFKIKEIKKKNTTSYVNNRIKKINEILMNSNINDIFIDFEYLNNEKHLLLKCDTCNNEYSISNFSFKYRVDNNIHLCTICEPLNSFRNKSSSEIELGKFLEKYDPNISFNNRELIQPLEVDIYLPKYKLAVEYNGLYWHSSLNKDKNYHYMKSKLLKKVGIDLIHIWEDDYLNRRKLVIDNILNHLGKLDIVEVSNYEIKVVNNTNDIKDFYNKWSLKLYKKSSIKLSINKNNEVIGYITFKKYKGRYYLNNYCIKMNYILNLNKFHEYLKNNLGIYEFHSNIKLNEDYIKVSSINYSYNYLNNKKRSYRGNIKIWDDYYFRYLFKVGE